jgi:hypothetical protein
MLMNLKRMFGWRWSIATVAMILVVSGCRINGGALRGKEMLFLSLPIHAAQAESITVTSDRVASRSFIPVTVHTAINRMIVPDSLWNDLEQLRQSWCQHQPSFVSAPPNTTAYGIVLKCDWAEDAIYYASSTDLPAPLHALINLVPATSERLLPQ